MSGAIRTPRGPRGAYMGTLGLGVVAASGTIPQAPERPAEAPWPEGHPITCSHVPQGLTEAQRGRKTQRPPGSLWVPGGLCVAAS
jgi:hypothetical protein